MDKREIIGRIQEEWQALVDTVSQMSMGRSLSQGSWRDGPSGTSSVTS